MFEAYLRKTRRHDSDDPERHRPYESRKRPRLSIKRFADRLRSYHFDLSQIGMTENSDLVEKTTTKLNKKNEKAGT